MKRSHTLTQAADILGCDAKTLRRSCNDPNDPCPHDKLRNGQYRVDAPELTAWARERGKTWGEMGRPVSVNASPDLDAARLRKENALAEKYELQVERERGELLVAERVERDWLQSAQVIRNKLIGLPASVAPQLEGMTAAEMQTLLETRVNEILNELADGFEADETTSEGAAASAPSQAE